MPREKVAKAKIEMNRLMAQKLWRIGNFPLVVETISSAYFGGLQDKK